MPLMRGLCLLAGMLTVAVAGAVVGQDITEDEPDLVETVESPPIASGFVILDGRYLPAPYVLRQQGDEFWINDHPVELAKLTRLLPEHGGPGRPGGFGGPAGRMGGGSGGEWRGPRGNANGPGEGTDAPGGEWRRRRSNFGGPGGAWAGPGGGWPQRSRGFQLSVLNRVKRQLEANSMLIVMEQSSQELDEKDALYTISTLLSEEPNDAKTEQIVEWKPGGIAPEDWAAIVAGFQPTTELVERTKAELEKLRPIWAKNMAAHQALVRSEFFRSKPVQYVITILAMGLAVVAVGTLLTHRPAPHGNWRDIDDAKEHVTMVVRNVALLAALSGVDLFLTFVAQQGGGFLEVNPLASGLMENPMLLGTFKLTSLAVACLILISLRRYRGAQVASWWLCLLCTILTFRWLTYNSLFSA